MTDHHLTESRALEELSTGKTELLANNLEVAANALQLATQHQATRLEAHNLIERHALKGCFRDMFGLNCEISPSDDIFHYFASHPTSVNPLRDYLADGWRTLSELMLLLESVNKPLLKTGNFLEFASGHGRFTRHLVKALGAARVTVSDVVQDAVEFSTHTFGVVGFQSSIVPEEVVFPKRYDVVFVLSLFSHLPRHSWNRWLRCLFEAVEPGGVLVFSTHGLKAAKHDNVELDSEGFFFAPSSESSALDAQEYGTTFTSEAFVMSQIGQTMGADVLVQRAPLQFWNHQDGYVLRRAL